MKPVPFGKSFLHSMSRCVVTMGFSLVLLGLMFSIFTMASAQAMTTLPQVVRMTMAQYFSPTHTQDWNRWAAGIPVSPMYKQPAGLFVTLSVNGRSRACWGTLFPEHANQVQATVFNTLGALTKEYRFPPIRPDEWEHLKPQVTVVKGIEPVSSLAAVNPLRDGLMVRSGGKSGIILPGEARNAHYQLVQCKLKAGIQPGERYQIYRIRTDVYR